MKKPILEVLNLTKVIDDQVIIDQVSFSLYPGEVVGFLGPNGAGKTTTIRMIVGLMAPTEGRVVVNGFNVHTQLEQALQYIGAIVENPELYKFLTGYENLLHFARMVPGITEERIAEVVELVGLTERIHEEVRTYSLGMRQRLGLAQALLHKPKVLILDEPTNGLDPAGIRQFREYFRELAHKQGLAILVSSHLISEIELMCDRILVIQDGKLVAERKVKQQEIQERLEIHFIVSPKETAVKKVQQLFGQYPIQETQEGFVITIPREVIPKVNQALVKEKIQVFGIERKSKTLEDEFMEITGGVSVV